MGKVVRQRAVLGEKGEPKRIRIDRAPYHETKPAEIHALGSSRAVYPDCHVFVQRTQNSNIQLDGRTDTVLFGRFADWPAGKRQACIQVTDWLAGSRSATSSCALQLSLLLQDQFSATTAKYFALHSVRWLCTSGTDSHRKHAVNVIVGLLN